MAGMGERQEATHAREAQPTDALQQTLERLQDGPTHRLSHRFVFKNRETLRSLVDAVIGVLGSVIEGWF